MKFQYQLARQTNSGDIDTEKNRNVLPKLHPNMAQAGCQPNTISPIAVAGFPSITRAGRYQAASFCNVEIIPHSTLLYPPRAAP